MPLSSTRSMHGMLVIPANVVSLDFVASPEGNSILRSSRFASSPSEDQPTTTSLSMNFFCKEFKSGMHFRQGMLHSAPKSLNTNLASSVGFSPNHLSGSKAGAGRPNKEFSEIGSARLSSELTGDFWEDSVPSWPCTKNVVASVV